MTSKSYEPRPPVVVFIAGHWLGAWAWDRVIDFLSTKTMRPIALTLPGLDENDEQRTSRTLEDQIRAIEEVVGSTTDEIVIIAHSGANAPVSVVLDRHPDRISHVVWVDSGPVGPGSVFAPDLAYSIDEVPLPSFEILGQQASLKDLDENDLEEFRRRAVPQPGSVMRARVELYDPARLCVPTTFVCCSITSVQIQELARAEHPMFAEVGKLAHPDFVDLPTGHWPMWSRPADLAEIIGRIIAESDCGVYD